MIAKTSADFVVIGGGCVGLRIAIELAKKFGGKANCKVVLLEKEMHTGMHASGRNSGVLHAGFYYSADSFKAKFTRQGNIALTQYILERGLPLNQCGKLVVVDEAKQDYDLKQLDVLLERARLNGVVSLGI
jgi:L-2-hydroxyglutarate oxidase